MIYKASIIIPIYNECIFLENLCEKIKLSFTDTDIKFIFVDDGSKDGSGEWLSKNLRNYFNNNKTQNYKSKSCISNYQEST